MRHGPFRRGGEPSEAGLHRPRHTERQRGDQQEARRGRARLQPGPAVGTAPAAAGAAEPGDAALPAVGLVGLVPSSPPAPLRHDQSAPRRDERRAAPLHPPGRRRGAPHVRRPLELLPRAGRGAAAATGRRRRVPHGAHAPVLLRRGAGGSAPASPAPSPAAGGGSELEAGR
ncbi:hypothetical protein THAOC_13798, partial [Thalassiosira oceanica]